MGDKGISRLEVRWSRCAWKPRILCDPIAQDGLVPEGASQVMTLYRRSGRRVSPRAGVSQAMPVVDWLAVRHDNPPSRITF
jgi:hypothetical protein